jgi:hypothetical protein
MPRHPVSVRIDDAIALLRRHSHDVTPSAIRVNVKKALTWADFSSEEALDAVIDRHLPARFKAHGYIITDSTPRDGGRERKDFWSASPDEFEEQIRVKRESNRYDLTRLKADEAILTLLREKEKELGYEVYPGLFHAEIDRIYAMHHVSAPGMKAA